MVRRTPNHTVYALMLLLVLLAPVRAAEEKDHKGSGLPVPRFVSLKFDKVNVRQGPARDHAVSWSFTRRGLPVEIIAEFDVWRRVRDDEGAEGWVFHSLLSGKRTALVAPWSKATFFDIHRRADSKSPVVARLEPKVQVDVAACDTAWCKVEVKGIEGHIRQESLWGVYPNESVD